MNKKGGVGKTTISLYLSQSLSEQGEKVLYVDTDPGSSASKVLGFAENELAKICTIADVLFPSTDVPLKDAIIERKDLPKRKDLRKRKDLPNDWGFDFIPSEKGLNGWEQSWDPGKEYKIQEKINQLNTQTNTKYDSVVFDSAPNFGYLSTATLIASNGVLAVTTPDWLSSEVLSGFLRTQSQVEARYKLNTKIVYVVINAFDSRTTHHHEVCKGIETIVSNLIEWNKENGIQQNIRIHDEIIPSRIRIADAMSCGVPLKEYPDKTGRDLCAIFSNLAEKIAQEIRKK